jgi:hypothetical protein
VAQEDLQKKVQLAFLSAFYGNLLTEKQRRVLSLHCEEDMSLGEIAEEMGISRQAAHEALARASAKMAEMEASLGLAARYRRMESGLGEALSLLRGRNYHQAEQVIEALLVWDQEDQHGL